MLLFPIVGKDFVGHKIILTEDLWKHIIFKHSEVGNDPAVLFFCLKNPDEVYQQRNSLHALLRQGKRFLLVIYASGEDEGYIWTS